MQHARRAPPFAFCVRRFRRRDVGPGYHTRGESTRDGRAAGRVEERDQRCGL
jgi:hypothetical protein